MRKTSPLNRITYIFGISALAFIFVFSLPACNSDSTGDETTGDGDSSEVISEIPEEKEEVAAEVEEALYPIPTSFDLTAMLEEAGASFILDIANPTENAEKYMTEKQQALNLGVYGADLSYASTYEQTQQVMYYLEASEKLMDALSISSAYNETLVDDVETNLDNRDSLVNLITNSFYDTYQHLNEKGKENLSLLIISGSWVESIYLASQLAATAPNKQEIVDILAKQKSSYDKLMGIMESNTDDANVAEVQEDLKQFEAIYGQIEDAETAQLTEEQFQQLTDITEKVRNKFTSVN